MTRDQMRAQLFAAYERREVAKAQADAADVEIKALRNAIAGYVAGEEAAKAKDVPKGEQA